MKYVLICPKCEGDNLNNPTTDRDIYNCNKCGCLFAIPVKILTSGKCKNDN